MTSLREFVGILTLYAHQRALFSLPLPFILLFCPCHFYFILPHFFCSSFHNVLFFFITFFFLFFLFSLQYIFSPLLFFFFKLYTYIFLSSYFKLPVLWACFEPPSKISSMAILYVQEVVTLQKKCLIYLHQKMGSTPFINYENILGWILFVYRAK